MESWTSYPSIYSLGHRAVADLLTVPVNVEEKIDGSQFSFGLSEDYGINVRSKGATMIADAPEKMFFRAVDTVKELAPSLTPGWTYRTEYLAKPKHNTLSYDRIPAKHLILFDVNRGNQDYLSYEEKTAEAARLGLEVVPLIYSGMVSSLDLFRSFLERQSILGGQKIEGVVVKPRDYNLYAPDKKVLMGKFVSEAFKEIHGGEWRKNNPVVGDIIQQIAERVCTPARWQKAIQHLAEAGKLEHSPRDIGSLMKEVPQDIEKECREEIMEALYKFAKPAILRRAVAGLPEWYKDHLLRQQFQEDSVEGH